MRIQRVQERSSIHAIASASTKSGGIKRARIATDHVVSTAARVIGIVDPELSVIENVEGLSTELNFAGFPNLEMFQHRHVEVRPSRIIQEVPASIPEGEPPRRYELRGAVDERTKALRIVAGRAQSMDNVGVGGCDAEPAGNPRVVGE